MAMNPFMDMKRGNSACRGPDDDQKHITEEFEMESGIDHAVGLELWEKLIKKLVSLFTPKHPEVMIDDDHIIVPCWIIEKWLLRKN